MKAEYLARLSQPVREFVHQVEQTACIEIEVVLDAKQNEGGSNGQGKLAVDIEAQRIRIFAPTNDYFPDGAVRHEVLHVKRFHCDGVPKLVLADKAAWDESLSDGLCNLDNAIEHVLIVPVELRFHQERRGHWEAVVADVCGRLSEIPVYERKLAFCMHWTFLQHALPGSPSIKVAREFSVQHGLLEMANDFSEQFLAVADSKEDIARVLFATFPELPRTRAALEYINNCTGRVSCAAWVVAINVSGGEFVRDRRPLRTRNHHQA
jgi:hypothetical protein